MVFFFFFNDTATTEIYTLSLHDALPIFFRDVLERSVALLAIQPIPILRAGLLRNPSFGGRVAERSEEHTSELQSRSDLVCRLLLEKKKKERHSWRSERAPRLQAPG